MQEATAQLIAQLNRLYLPDGVLAPAELARHVAGEVTHAVPLAHDGMVRAIVLPFDARPDADGAVQWERLCEVANRLQAELGLPAPAVSIAGASGYRLWLSFAAPLPAAMAQQLADALRTAYCPDAVPLPGGVLAPLEVPPCVHRASGRWAAFIHPGMGASFAEEPGLDFAPPPAAQAAFLQGLEGAGTAQLRHALDLLAPVPAPAAPAPAPAATPTGLLLKDATLEDIVRHLHSLNIEPTFRHLLRGSVAAGD